MARPTISVALIGTLRPWKRIRQMPMRFRVVNSNSSDVANPAPDESPRERFSQEEQVHEKNHGEARPEKDIQ